MQRTYRCELCCENYRFCFDSLIERKGFSTQQQLRTYSTRPLQDFIFSCVYCRKKLCDLCAKRNIFGELICRSCEIFRLNRSGPEVYPSFVSSSCRKMCRILFLVAQRLHQTGDLLGVLDKTIWRKIAVYAVGW